MMNYIQKKMNKKILTISIVILFIGLALAPSIHANTQQETESINSYSQEQPKLQYSITTNIDNVKSIFQFIIVTVTIKNLENESISLEMGGYPGGCFAIFDDGGKLINRHPKYFMTLLWGITLEPEEEYTLYQGIWFQRTSFYRLVRNGEYYIFGGTGLISFNDKDITPDPFGPVNITIARRFIP